MRCTAEYREDSDRDYKITIYDYNSDKNKCLYFANVFHTLFSYPSIAWPPLLPISLLYSREKEPEICVPRRHH